MKHFIFLLLTTTLLLGACKKDPTAVAGDFSQISRTTEEETTTTEERTDSQKTGSGTSNMLTPNSFSMEIVVDSKGTKHAGAMFQKDDAFLAMLLQAGKSYGITKSARDATPYYIKNRKPEEYGIGLFTKLINAICYFGSRDILKPKYKLLTPEKLRTNYFNLCLLIETGVEIRRQVAISQDMPMKPKMQVFEALMTKLEVMARDLTLVPPSRQSQVRPYVQQIREAARISVNDSDNFIYSVDRYIKTKEAGRPMSEAIRKGPASFTE